MKKYKVTIQEGSFPVEEGTFKVMKSSAGVEQAMINGVEPDGRDSTVYEVNDYDVVNIEHNGKQFRYYVNGDSILYKSIAPEVCTIVGGPVEPQDAQGGLEYDVAEIFEGRDVETVLGAVNKYLLNKEVNESLI